MNPHFKETRTLIEVFQLCTPSPLESLLCLIFIFVLYTSTDTTKSIYIKTFFQFTSLYFDVFLEFLQDFSLEPFHDVLVVVTVFDVQQDCVSLFPSSGLSQVYSLTTVNGLDHLCNSTPKLNIQVKLGKCIQKQKIATNKAMVLI